MSDWIRENLRGRDERRRAMAEREAELAAARTNYATAKEVAAERKAELNRAIEVDRERWKQADLEELRGLIAELPTAFGPATDLCRRAVQLAGNISVLHGYDSGNTEINTTTFNRPLRIDGQLPDELLAQAAATTASLPEQVTRGPSAAEERTAQDAERRRRREERKARLTTMRQAA